MNDSANVDRPTCQPLPGPLSMAPASGRRRWISFLLTLVIFASGVLIGAAGAAGFIRREILQVLRDPAGAPARITQRLKRRLALTDAQTARVQGILESRQQSLQSIRATIQPEVMKELFLAKSEVAEVLDERQRERWEADFDRLRDLWVPPMPEKPASGP